MKYLIMLISALILMALCFLPVMAEPQQGITNEQAYATVNLAKAPECENRQQIKNTKSWFCINIIINGKIKDSADNNKK